MNTRKTLPIFLVIAILSFFSLCTNIHGPTAASPPPSEEEATATASATVTVELGNIGRVGKVTRSTIIELDTLFIKLEARGVDPIEAAFPISGYGQNVVTATFDNLMPDRKYLLTAYSKDSTGAVIHSGKAKFKAVSGDTTQVSLALEAAVAMLYTRIYPVRPGINRVSLVVDDQIVADTVLNGDDAIGDTVILGYDYLTTDKKHSVQLVAKGDVYGNSTDLYEVDTTIKIAPGEAQVYKATMVWVGPDSIPPPATATMTVTLGPIGYALITGEVPLPRKEIRDTIAVSETWVADTGYVIRRTVVVPAGVTLTIDPGTILFFESGARIVVGGELLALGSTGNRITFTSNAEEPAAGDYAGIEILSTAVPASYDGNLAYQSGSAIQNADFRYGGGIAIQGVVVDLRNCSFEDIGLAESVPGIISVSGTAAGETQAIFNCTFSDSGASTIHMASDCQATMQMDSSVFENAFVQFAGPSFIKNSSFSGTIVTQASGTGDYFACVFKNETCFKGLGAFRRSLFQSIQNGPFDSTSLARQLALCTFFDCKTVRIRSDGYGAFRFNNFIDGPNVQYQVINAGTTNADAASCHWGALAEDAEAIAERIIDGNDEGEEERGIVSFLPDRYNFMAGAPLPIEE